MTAKEITAFEDNLKIGDKVIVRWTNSRHFMAAEGSIKKINERSVRVALDKDYPIPFQTGDVWPAGYEIIVPTYWSERWTANNRVEPLGGYR